MITVHHGYKYRIYPTGEQQRKIIMIFGCCRFVFNWALALRSSAWKNLHESINYTRTSAMLTALKGDKDHLWLKGKDVDSMALQEALRDLDKSFKNFFEKRASYPKFRKKYSSTQSYRTRNQNSGIRIVDKNHIRIPVIGILKAKVSRIPESHILNATITRTASGKYFVSLCAEEELMPKSNDGCMVGIDVGIKSFYTDSNGRSVEAPKPLKALESKLRREQRKLSRMLEANIDHYGPKRRPVWKKPLSECSNIQKQRVKVARIHERIANIRLDFLHKVSTKLVNENQVICVEDLNIKGMVRNHHLAKTINDVSWSKFFTMLGYKAFEHGCDVVKVPTFYPSSQTCSSCGYKNLLLKDLSVREWECPVCHAQHDRDVNAALNILGKGLEALDAS